MAQVETDGRPLVVRTLGRQQYEPVWRAMRQFTETRSAATPDEIWFTEHPPVFTLGLNADRSHVLEPGDIPVVPVDRGGQVTYHGPGQLMVYPLIHLRRANLGVRDLVTALERSAIAVLADYDVAAVCRADAPGVYVDGRKIASVGLRIRRGASFHGMAFNVDVDVSPFDRINPCGIADLEVTNCRQESISATSEVLRRNFEAKLIAELQMAGRELTSLDDDESIVAALASDRG